MTTLRNVSETILYYIGGIVSISSFLSFTPMVDRQEYEFTLPFVEIYAQLQLKQKVSTLIRKLYYKYIYLKQKLLNNQEYYNYSRLNFNKKVETAK